jgi:hypothetical protein
MDAEQVNGSAPADLEPTAPQSEVSAPSSLGSEPGDAQPIVAATTPPPHRPDPRSSLWPEGLAALAASFYEWLSRPRVRLTVTGVILLLIAGLILPNSVWTLPLVIIGALMVVIAWVGCRLDGRFALEWGEAGTQLEFRAKIKAAQPVGPAPNRAVPSAHTPQRTLEAEPGDGQVIDAEAHTVEVDVAELESMIAAAETSQAAPARVDLSGPPKHGFRITRSGHSSDAPR